MCDATFCRSTVEISNILVTVWLRENNQINNRPFTHGPSPHSKIGLPTIQRATESQRGRRKIKKALGNFQLHPIYLSFILTCIEGDVVLSIWPVDHPTWGRWKGHWRARSSHTLWNGFWSPRFVPGTNNHLFFIKGATRLSLEITIGATSVGRAWVVWNRTIPCHCPGTRFCRRNWAIYTWNLSCSACIPK